MKFISCTYTVADNLFTCTIRLLDRGVMVPFRYEDGKCCVLLGISENDCGIVFPKDIQLFDVIGLATVYDLRILFNKIVGISYVALNDFKFTYKGC